MADVESVRAACDAATFVRLAAINSRARSSVFFCASVLAFADFFRRPTLLLPRAGARAGVGVVFLLVDFTLDGATGGAFLVRPGGDGGPVECVGLR